jgi:hypothetical protein
MKKFLKTTALAVLVSFSSTFIVSPACAALVGTEQALKSNQTVERNQLKQFFDREDVAKALQEQGVTPEMAKMRVDAMTDEEAQQLAAHIEKAPAGAGIVGTLFTLFIILLVTDILGLTKVFPFTRSIR